MADKKHKKDTSQDAPAGAPVAPSQLWQRVRKPIISVFIIYHITAIGVWLVPSSRFRKMCLPLFNNYINAAGLWQYWCVFAPVPKKYNIYMSATIRYRDGSTSEWSFPRPDKLGYIERAYLERFRKFSNEGMWTKENARLLPDACRWIARNHSDRTRTPATVEIVKNWCWIEPPETGLMKPSPEPDQQSSFFTYHVKPEDLT